MLPPETVELVDVDEDAILRLGGNASHALKKRVMQYFTLGAYDNDTYGSLQGSRLLAKELWVNTVEERRLQVRMICEIRVENDMLDEKGELAVGFMTYLLDICSTYPIVAHAYSAGRTDDYFGVTQCLQCVFHSPAKLGTQLRIESTSVAIGGRSLVGRSEVGGGHADHCAHG